MKTTNPAISGPLDGLMKALFLEGLLGLPAATSASPRPLRDLERRLAADPAEAPTLDALRQGGWFSQDPASNLYATLHRRLEQSASRYGSSFADQALSEMMMRPGTERADTRSLVRDAGAMIARDELLGGKVPVERAVRLLSTMAWRKQIDMARAASPEWLDPVGGIPQLAYKADKDPCAPESASVAGTLADALADPGDPLGRRVLGLMRGVARKMYEKWRRPYAVPPMMRFIDLLAAGQLPSCTQIARDCEIADASLRLRHIKPFFAALHVEALAWQHRAEVVRLLKERGCSAEDAEGWAEGWGTNLVQRRPVKAKAAQALTCPVVPAFLVEALPGPLLAAELQ